MSVKISPNIQNNKPQFKGTLLKGKAVSQKTSNWVEKAGNLSSPANRFILGITALLFQPIIDLHNKNVDEDTRIVSCAREIAKNFVGMITGIIVRAGSIKLIDKFSVLDPKDSKPWHKAFIPSNISFEKFVADTRKLQKHKEAVGTCLALAVMIVTNFAVDVPLTKVMTNYLNKKFKKAGLRAELKSDKKSKEQPSKTIEQKNENETSLKGGK